MKLLVFLAALFAVTLAGSTNVYDVCGEVPTAVYDMGSKAGAVGAYAEVFGIKMFF